VLSQKPNTHSFGEDYDKEDAKTLVSFRLRHVMFQSLPHRKRSYKRKPAFMQIVETEPAGFAIGYSSSTAC